MLRISIMTFAAIGALVMSAPARADYEDPLAGLFSGLHTDAPVRQTTRGAAVAERETPKAEAQGSGADRHWGKHHHHGVLLEGSF
jgi:hypothetical protein